MLDAYGIRSPIHVVPNGIPQTSSTGTGNLSEIGEFGKSPNLIFVGHLGYHPNVEAVDRLARDIFPLVRAQFPKATLHLVGRYPKPQVRALADLPGVKVHENPADVGPFLAQADITVIPLTKGGGSRIKILEAASCGVPVVATAIAAEGLVLTDCVEIIIANSNEELVQETIALLSNNKRRDALRRSAFASVRRLYDDASIARFVDIGLGN